MTGQSCLKAEIRTGREYGFRSAICHYLYQARGVLCSPEQIVVGAGSDYILMMSWHAAWKGTSDCV